MKSKKSTKDLEGIVTFHDPSACPPWIAIFGGVKDLLEVRTMERAPAFAAGGESEAEAIGRLAEKRDMTGQVGVFRKVENPEFTNLHQVRLMLRRAALKKQQTVELGILLCLFAHHPRKVLMATILSETGCSRSSVRDYLARMTGQVEDDRIPDMKYGPGCGHTVSYWLNEVGLKTCVNYLRMLKS